MISRLRHSVLAVACAGLVPLAGLADDETYDLRGPAAEKGQICVIAAKSIGKDLVRKFGVQEKTFEEKFDEIGSKKKEVEILAVEGNETVRLRTKVVKDQREETARRGKKEFKRTNNGSLHGQIVYSERTKTGWKNTLEDVKPDEKQKRALKEFVPFREDDAFLPKEKVKVGHTWNIEQAAFAKAFGSHLEDMRGKGTGKFQRVEKGDDETIAVIEVEFEVTGKSKDDEMTLDVTLKGKGTSHRSLKLGFDRKSTMFLKVAMKGGGERDGEKVDFEFNGTIDGDDTVELKLKK
jgi:hypothetical protein